MNKLKLFSAFIVCLLLASATVLPTGDLSARPAGDDLWPTKGWATASPGNVGLDEQVLLGLDKDMASGKYSQMMDSFAVFRCGKKVFERSYAHDYAKIYGKEAGERGPLNARLAGRYNYFDPYWHPYYHGTDLHTMQSVSKTVTSVIIGAAYYPTVGVVDSLRAGTLMREQALASGALTVLSGAEVTDILTEAGRITGVVTSRKLGSVSLMRM